MASGLATRPLTHVLADLVVWLAQHPVDDERVARGTLLFRDHRYLTPWPDVHAWVAGLLDEEALERYLLAFLALDWRRQDVTRLPGPGPKLRAIDPDLAVLQGFTSASVFLPGTPANADDGRVGCAEDWPLRLRAGHVDQVCRDAAAVLRRCRIRVFTLDGPALRSANYVRRPVLSSDQGQGSRLLAALCAPASTGALRALSVIDRPNDSAPNPTTLDEGASA